MRAVGVTAQLTAAVRAGESERPDRLFEDPYARLLAGEDGFALLADVAAGLPPGAVSTGVTIRARWIDDQLLDLLRAGLLTQVVLLAAGRAPSPKIADRGQKAGCQPQSRPRFAIFLGSGLASRSARRARPRCPAPGR